MAEKPRPLSPQEAPDPSNAYERSHPENEAGMGKLTQPQTTPRDRPDEIQKSPKNKKDPTRQLNGEDSVDQRAKQ